MLHHSCVWMKIGICPILAKGADWLRMDFCSICPTWDFSSPKLPWQLYEQEEDLLWDDRGGERLLLGGRHSSNCLDWLCGGVPVLDVRQTLNVVSKYFHHCFEYDDHYSHHHHYWASWSSIYLIVIVVIVVIVVIIVVLVVVNLGPAHLKSWW